MTDEEVREGAPPVRNWRNELKEILALPPGVRYRRGPSEPSPAELLKQEREKTKYMEEYNKISNERKQAKKTKGVSVGKKDAKLLQEIGFLIPYEDIEFIPDFQEPDIEAVLQMEAVEDEGEEDLGKGKKSIMPETDVELRKETVKEFESHMVYEEEEQQKPVPKVKLTLEEVLEEIVCL